LASSQPPAGSHLLVVCGVEGHDAQLESEQHSPPYGAAIDDGLEVVWWQQRRREYLRAERTQLGLPLAQAAGQHRARDTGGKTCSKQRRACDSEATLCFRSIYPRARQPRLARVQPGLRMEEAR